MTEGHARRIKRRPVNEPPYRWDSTKRFGWVEDGGDAGGGTPVRARHQTDPGVSAAEGEQRGLEGSHS